VEDKEIMEEHLMERNIEHFLHAGKTPFGYSDLGAELGHTGDSQMANDILECTLQHACLSNEAIRAIVNHLREHPMVQHIWKPIVTPEDFTSCFKCVPKKTASSLSGRSVPHYKACSQIKEEWVGELLASIHAAMMTLTFDAVFCPERWRKAVDVMLEKIPGAIRTNKLRIIQLLEADLNQVLRSAFARNISKLAQEKDGIINEYQYGRSHQTCISPILDKFLTIHILIQKKTNGIVFDKDAKGCYDWIIIRIALLSIRRLGYSKNSVKMLGELFEQLEHHISTGLGVSDISYSSTLEKLLYGIGQGRWSSPILWAILNQLILTSLEEKYECKTLVSVDRTTISTRPGDAFVDDTTTGTTDEDVTKEPVPIEENELTSDEEAMVKRMEDIITFFLDLLQLTGGDLAPEKFVWFLTAHRWKKGVPTFLANKSTHRGITMQSKATWTISEVKRKAVSQGHKTLGFHLCRDGTSRAHKKVMKEKAIKYGGAIMSSSLKMGNVQWLTTAVTWRAWDMGRQQHL
jgi:hypothetical protein